MVGEGDEMTHKPTVYLAGPIAGLTFQDAAGWRETAIVYLRTFGVQGKSPMRGKEHLRHITSFTNQGYEENPVSSQKGIVTRDRFDVRTSDMVLMNCQCANKLSVGTAVELGWADAFRVPVVLVADISDASNPFSHAFFKEIPGYIVKTLEEGLAICVSVLAC